MTKEKTVRTHITIPETLLKEVDKHIPKGERSDFVTEAIASEIENLKLKTAAKKVASSKKARAELDFWEGAPTNKWLKKLKDSEMKRLGELDNLRKL